MSLPLASAVSGDACGSSNVFMGINFSRVQNLGSGNSLPQFFANGTAYSNGSEIRLSDDSGNFIADSSIGNGVQGLAVQRLAGKLRIKLEGTGDVGSKEIIDAVLSFRNVTIFSIENEGLENQGDSNFDDTGNDDEVTISPNRRSVGIKMRVTGPDNDSFVINYGCLDGNRLVCGPPVVITKFADNSSERLIVFERETLRNDTTTKIEVPAGYFCRRAEITIVGFPLNQPPLAICEVNPISVLTNNPATFNGSKSFDPDGYIVSWIWKFDDSSTLSGQAVTKSFSTAGVHTANLTVTDNEGKKDWVLCSVNIDRPPISTPNIDVGNNGVWEWFIDGFFNGTATVDFTEELNSILPSCDCPGCTFNEARNTCTIDVVLGSVVPERFRLKDLFIECFPERQPPETDIQAPFCPLGKLDFTLNASDNCGDATTFSRVIDGSQSCPDPVPKFDWGIVSEWKLDEGKGCFAKDTFDLNNGTLLSGIRLETKRNTCLTVPNSHDELMSCLSNALNESGWRGVSYVDSISQNENIHGNDDFYTSNYSALFYVSAPGVWLFATDSDEASEIEIDGSVVANWYGPHSACNCTDHNGGINLTKGWHRLAYRHAELAGQQLAKAYFRPISSPEWKAFSISSAGICSEDFWAGGQIGNAVTFGHNLTRVFVPDSDNLDIRHQITLEAWINPSAHSDFARIIKKEGAYSLFLHSNGRIGVTFQGFSNPGPIFSNSIIPAGTWTHVAAVWDPNVTSIYINGVLDRSVPNPGAGLASDAGLTIGNSYAGGPTGGLATIFGDGSDGPLTVSSPNVVVNDYAYVTDSGLAAGSITLNVDNAAAFSPGNEILIIQMQDAANAGTYEFRRIASKSGNAITLTSSLNSSYTSGIFNIANAKATQIVRIPQYANVTVTSGGSITAAVWNGYKGGIIAFRATGTVNIIGSVGVTVKGKGYRGGAAMTSLAQIGKQGESFNGNPQAQSRSNNQGGGGGGSASIGAGRPGGGTGGGYSANGGNTSGEQGTSTGGSTYGSAGITTLFLGSGGGSGGTDNTNVCGTTSGAGGSGGGAIFITGKTITVSGSISAKGNDGQGISCFQHASGGGGSGGSIYLGGFSLTLGSNLVDGTGGAGGTGSDHNGAAGGDGRIRLEYSSLSGTTNPVPGYQGNVTATVYSSGYGPSSIYEPFFGRIDEARIYNLALSASQIQQLYGFSAFYRQGLNGTIECASGTCEKKVCFFSRDRYGNTEDVESQTYKINSTSSAPVNFCDGRDNSTIRDNTCFFGCNTEACGYGNSCPLSNFCDGTVRKFNGACSANGCSFTTENCADRNYVENVTVCSGNNITKRFIFHNFTCAPEGCRENVTFRDELIDNCDSRDGQQLNQCGLLDWSCSEELNRVDCVVTDVKPDSSRCSGNFCQGETRNFNGTCNSRNFTCEYQKQNCNALDFFGNFSQFCSGDEVRQSRDLHDFSCTPSACTETVSIVNETVVENCNSRDGDLTGACGIEDWTCRQSSPASCALANVSSENGFCPGSFCNVTFTDFCAGAKLTDYNRNRITDSVNVQNSTMNFCSTDFICTSEQAACLPPSPATSCVEGACGAICDSADDFKVVNNACIFGCDTQETCGFSSSISLDSFCQNDVRHFNGACTSSGAVFQEEDCNSRDFYEDIDFCDGSSLKKKRLFHDFSCAPDGCREETRIVNITLLENCNGRDFNESLSNICSGDNVVTRINEHDFSCRDAACAEVGQRIYENVTQNCNSLDFSETESICSDKRSGNRTTSHDFFCSNGACTQTASSRDTVNGCSLACGATCTNDAQCNDQNEDTIDTCNLDACGCLNIPKPFGCIEVKKEAFNPQNHEIRPVPQFGFKLDGNQTKYNDGSGAAKFSDVPIGWHTVSEILPEGWDLIQKTPSDGRVLVEPGSICSAVLFKDKQKLPPATCGDGAVNQQNETCELPNTPDNSNCPQTASACLGNKTGTRDSLGSCSFACSCVEDSFSYSCVENSCGAVCNSPDDFKVSGTACLSGCDAQNTCGFTRQEPMAPFCSSDNAIFYHSAACTASGAVFQQQNCSAMNFAEESTICIGDKATRRKVFHTFSCSASGCREEVRTEDTSLQDCSQLDGQAKREFCDGKILKENTTTTDGFCQSGACRTTLISNVISKGPSSVCGAECLNDADCPNLLIGSQCNFNGACTDGVCRYSQQACPVPGKVASNTCYYGTQACTQNGCPIQSCALRENQECDASRGCVDLICEPIGTIDRFADSSTQKNLTFNAGGGFSDEPKVSVPKFVNVSGKVEKVKVTKASLNLTGYQKEFTFDRTLDSIVVTDVSQSMELEDPPSLGTKMDRAKAADKEFINLVMQSDRNRIGLASYSGRLMSSVPLTNDKAKLISEVNSYSPNGFTCISCGLQKAIDLIKDGKNDVRTIVLMSDGVANRCLSGYCNATKAKQEAIGKACEAWNVHKARVFAVSFVDEVDIPTMMAIAACGNGKHFVANGSTIVSIYREIAIEMASSLPRNVSVDISTDGVTDIFIPGELGATVKAENLASPLNNLLNGCSPSDTNCTFTFRTSSKAGGTVQLSDLRIEACRLTSPSQIACRQHSDCGGGDDHTDFGAWQTRSCEPFADSCDTSAACIKERNVTKHVCNRPGTLDAFCSQIKEAQQENATETRVTEGLACDDSLFCTTNETCSNGRCIGLPRICEDSDVCTLDGCSETLDLCLHMPNPLNASCSMHDHDHDGVDDSIDSCPNTTASSVVDNQGCSCYQKTCGDGDPRTSDSCNAQTAQCAYTSIDDDGDGITNQNDACPGTAAGSVTDQAGCSCTQKTCSDGNASTTDSCNPSTAACLYRPDSDSDGVADADDNCPSVANSNQEDSDSDGIGNACDTQPSNATARTLFTQVMYDAPNDDNSTEWFEIYNPTEISIDISGWKIRDNRGSYTIPIGTHIDSGRTLLIAANTALFESRYGFEPDIGSFPLPLGNNGDVLRLFNRNDTEVDMVAWENYVAGWSIVAIEGKSILRKSKTVDTDSPADWLSNQSPVPDTLS
ncbi:MAG: lamin tail domain-containing protein [Candidatus Aenigmarchaeota archaeon]|nr:lamin tail domain-containing protein [Candidatus Aenigmarchaeota archaeon]